MLLSDWLGSVRRSASRLRARLWDRSTANRRSRHEDLHTQAERLEDRTLMANVSLVGNTLNITMVDGDCVVIVDEVGGNISVSVDSDDPPNVNNSSASLVHQISITGTSGPSDLK